MHCSCLHVAQKRPVPSADVGFQKILLKLLFRPGGMFIITLKSGSLPFAQMSHEFEFYGKMVREQGYPLRYCKAGFLIEKKGFRRGLTSELTLLAGLNRFIGREGPPGGHEGKGWKLKGEVIS